MTQPFDPNAMNEEEVRIRRMLAYKSLVLSILQRSFIFLLFIAVVVAALVLILLYRQGQKNFFRYRGSANLIYSPSRAKTYDHPPLSIANVYQIISTPIVKKNAGELSVVSSGIPTAITAEPKSTNSLMNSTTISHSTAEGCRSSTTSHQPSPECITTASTNPCSASNAILDCQRRHYGQSNRRLYEGKPRLG